MRSLLASLTLYSALFLGAGLYPSGAAAEQDQSAAGYPQAEVLDGRQAPLLFCCFRIVVAGRHATQEEAIAAAAAAKKKSLKVYVRQGF